MLIFKGDFIVLIIISSCHFRREMRLINNVRVFRLNNYTFTDTYVKDDSSI